jgi:plastocyanin
LVIFKNFVPLNNLRLRRALVASVVAVSLSGCGGGDKPAPSAPPADARRVDEAKAGQVAGRVLIDGQVPVQPAVAMDGDCAAENKDGLASETFAVDEGGLNTVFVYIKDGLGSYYFETPSEPVTLDQKGCRYIPHVIGVRVGQPVEFVNSDPTVHNIRAAGQANRGFNFTQKMAGMRDKRTFTAREVMVRLKCDVHHWMNAYAGVLDHPYFAVTGNGGRFELRNVPAGTYTVEAWHEQLGTQTQQVTLGEKESKKVTFTFRTS